jgi:hypothetical protein
MTQICYLKNMTDEFQAALEKARQELKQIETDEQRLAQRKAQLLHSIAGLAALCGEVPEIQSMTLADAIRNVFQNAFYADPKHGLTPREVRQQLRSFGFDLNQFAHAMGSIHTAIKRMLASGELEPFGDPDFGGYRWRVPYPPESLELWRAMEARGKRR